MSDDEPTVRELAEDIVSIGVGLSAAHPIGSKISDHGKAIIRLLDAAAEHRHAVGHATYRLVPDPVGDLRTIDSTPDGKSLYSGPLTPKGGSGLQSSQSSAIPNSA